MKLNIIAAFAGAILLSGCQAKLVEEMSYSEQNELARTVGQRCVNQGVSIKSKEFNTCAKHEMERERLLRHKAQRDSDVAWGVVRGAAQGYAQANQQSSRSVTCTSTPHSTWVNGPVSHVSTTCN